MTAGPEPTRDEAYLAMALADLDHRPIVAAGPLDQAGRDLGTALLLVESLARAIGARSIAAQDLPWADRPVTHRAVTSIYSLVHSAQKALAELAAQGQS